MTNVLIRSLLIRSILLTPFGLSFVAAQAQSVAARFLLEFRGQKIGSASYQFTKSASGVALKADYSYVLGLTNITCTREAELEADDTLESDTLHIQSGQKVQTVLIKANRATGKLDYAVEESAGIGTVTSQFDLRPGVVILNNFDPSGLQTLISLADATPQPGGKYTALLAQGKGIELAATFTPEASSKGTLDGKGMEVRRWTLTLGGITGQVLADQDGNLMEFVIPAQGVSYLREGFELSDPRVLYPAAAVPPPGLQELSVSFRSDGLNFPATVTLPRTHGASTPIVVMVQGSGPQDAEETIGSIKVFRDLAWGLAQQGIATLRYPKRTYFAPQTFTVADVDHEVTRDAVAALALASTMPGIDPHRVLLLGHSLGGMMAPVIVMERLEQQAGSVRGIIFLAASVEPFQKTILRQVMLAVPSAQQEAVQSQWKAIFKTMNDPATPADQKVGVDPLLAPESYWRSLLRQDPAAELTALKMPALVLHGTQDSNVFLEDYNDLAMVNTAPGSMNRQFDGLNHFFVVAGVERGKDPAQPEHVAPEVISAIADWIKSLQ